MKYELTKEGKALRRIWSNKWEQKLKDKGLENGFEGTEILDTIEDIKNITDECGWLILTYDIEAITVLNEWATFMKDKENSTCAGGFTIKKVKEELLKYLKIKED